MRIEGLMEETAAEIARIPAVGDAKVFREDAGDVSKEFEISISKAGRCLVVCWGGCEHVATGRAEGEDPAALVVQATLTVSVFDKPPVNCAASASPRLLAMAQAVARHLDGLGTEDMDEGLHLYRITPIQAIGHGVVTCDVVFRTKLSLTE